MKRILVTVLFLSGCSFKGADSSSVSLKFTFDPPSPPSGASEFFNFPTGYISPPSNISKFDCLAVNVMGDGIAPLYSGEFKNNFSDLKNGNVCGSYPGVSTYMVNANSPSTVELRVPSGAGRYIQVLGFPRTDQGCRNDKPVMNLITEAGSSISYISRHFGGMFEVGSTIRDLFRDEEVTIQNRYNSAQPRDILNCMLGTQPYEISGLKLWYTADFFDEIYGNGQAIQSADNWNNIAPGQGVTPQLTAANGVTYKTTGGPNGNPSLNFTGGTAFQRSATGFAPTATGASIFVVGRNTGGANPGTLVGIDDGTGSCASNDFFSVGYNSSGYFEAKVNKNPVINDSATISVLSSSFHIMSAIFDINAVPRIDFKVSQYGATSSATTNTTGTVNLGGYVFAGWCANNLNGDISEVIVYDRALTIAERDKVRNYLSLKYAIAD